MKASKAIAGFTCHVQNQLTLRAMKARINRKIQDIDGSAFEGIVTDPTAAWMFALALAIVCVALGAVSSLSAQPVGLTILAVLATCGLFFLLAVSSGRLSIAGRSSRRPQDLIADAWPEAGLITTRMGATVYSNRAFGLLVPEGQGGGIPALEAWFTSEPQASEALFRLVRAGERGETRTEEIELGSSVAANVSLPRQALRITVAPLLAGPLPAGSASGPLVAWQLADVSAQREKAKLDAGVADSRFGAYHLAPVGLLAIRGDGSVAHLNSALLAMLGAADHPAPDDALQLETLFSRPGADVLRRHLGRNPPTGVQCALDLVTRTGRRLPVRVFAAHAPPLSHPAQGERILVVMRNEWVEPAIAAGEAADPSFARHFQSAPFGIATLTSAGIVARANPAFSQMVLGDSAGLGDRAIDILCAGSSAEARATVEQSLAEALAGQAGLAPVDFAAGAKGEYGRRIYITPLLPQPGSREAAILYVVDTTEQKALEAKFAQSQKMEAIGKLAGGIAHDFNNVLTAIIGSADLMLQTHRASDASHKDIQNIKQSANRAAGLVGKLMAFSRQQTLQLEVLQLGDVVTDLRPMLKTSLGEKIDLQVTTGRDLWYVKADRTQVDQVIVNFAVNA